MDNYEKAMSRRRITKADILPDAEYARRRAALRQAIVARKKLRRVAVGPAAMFHFECFETMLRQIQEMLYIEKGGDAQLEDELAAYNPLVPQGNELVATVMFEIDDPARRARFLAGLGGIEHRAFLAFDGMRIFGVAEKDQERTNSAGKASAVQFIHFPFTPTEIAAFCQAGQQVVIGFDHAAYAHMSVIPEAMRAELARDFD